MWRGGISLADHKKSLTALRYKTRSVDNKGIDTIAKAVQSKESLTKIRTLIGRKETGYIL